MDNRNRTPIELLPQIFDRQWVLIMTGENFHQQIGINLPEEEKKNPRFLCQDKLAHMELERYFDTTTS